MEVLATLLEKWDVIALVIGINLLLGGLEAVLGWIASKTESKADDKIVSWLGKSTKLLSKLVELLNGKVEKKE